LKYLQIWLGKKPNKYILDCMKSVLDRVSDNDEYILISNTNFLKDKNITWINSNDYIKEIKQNSDIDFVWKKIQNTTKGYCYKSDIIRLDYLSKNDDVLYLDCDITLLDDLIFEKGIVYLSNFGKKYDCYLMYGDKKFFGDALKYCILNIKDYPNIPHSWILRILNSRKLISKYDCKFIDVKKYKHKG